MCGTNECDVFEYRLPGRGIPDNQLKPAIFVLATPQVRCCGSAQESVEARILGCFPEDDEFGLGGRYPLRFQQEVTQILIAPTAP